MWHAWGRERCLTGLWLAGLCEQGNEPSGSIRKQGIFFFDNLSYNRLFK
jgi:hypothetical protein